MSAPTVGSVFSGIGGLDLGLERAGWDVRWQAENDPYCSRVLKQHWPDVPNLGDVTKVDWSDVERVDLICGGFPCPPVSYAGLRRGYDDPRWLWPWMRDALRVLRPRLVLIENVAGLVTLGLGAVLADLSDLGFDADWETLRACSVGASHSRERVFIVAYDPGSDVESSMSRDPWKAEGDLGRAESRGSGRGESRPGRWLPEPSVDRMADGVPRSVVRAPLEALGNAVVPQVAEFIGAQLLKAISAPAQEVKTP